MFYKSLTVGFISLILATTVYAKTTIGYDDWPPNEMTQNGQATGITVDITNQILSLIDEDATYTEYPWKRGTEMLRHGGIDILLAGHKTEKRAEEGIRFSRRPTSCAIWNVYTTQEILDSVGIDKLLEDGVVTTHIGYDVPPEFKEQYPNLDFLEKSTANESLVRMLGRGRIKLALMERGSVLKYAEKNDVELVPLGYTLKKDVYMLFGPNMKDSLIERINDGIDTLYENGTIPSIQRGYGYFCK